MPCPGFLFSNDVNSGIAVFEMLHFNKFMEAKFEADYSHLLSKDISVSCLMILKIEECRHL